MNSNLENVCEGDVVVLDKGGDCQRVRVARTTPTQIILTYKNAAGDEYERKFRRSDGREIGDFDLWSGNRGWLYGITDETRGELEKMIAKTAERRNRQKAIAAIQRTNLDYLPTDTLLSLAKQIEEAIEAKKAATSNQ